MSSLSEDLSPKCIKCHKNNDSKFKACDLCRQKERIRRQKKRDVKKKEKKSKPEDKTICSECRETKPEDKFKTCEKCREKNRLKSKNEREKIKNDPELYEKNKEKKRQYQRKYIQNLIINNTEKYEKLLEYKREYMRKRMLDPEFAKKQREYQIKWCERNGKTMDELWNKINSNHEDPWIGRDRLENIKKLIQIQRYVKKNLKHWIFKRWIKSKEGVEWLYHPDNIGGKCVKKQLEKQLEKM